MRYLAVLMLFCSNLAFGQLAIDPNPKDLPNIVLLIGDGMGLSQVSSAYYFSEKEPNFSRFPFTGLSRTSSSSHKITDSAAGATALSTGKKTYNSAIGVDADTNAVETILEYMEKRGWNTGLVATSSITHATPASFYAHVDSRHKPEEIAKQLVYSGIDFFAGGGLEYFTDREDKVDLVKEMEKRGYKIFTDEMKEPEWSELYYPCGYLLSKDGMPKMQEGRGDFLTKATESAIESLSIFGKPFFLMVEGSQIDWGGHANDGEYIVQEVLDFDAAIGKVLDFARLHGNTLVIVTADHETGGFTLRGKEKEVPFQGRQRDYDDIDFGFSSGGHSATMVPVFAYGPGANLFSGVYQNTEIYFKMMEVINK